MRLTAEALSLRCEVLGFLGWYAALMDVDGHSFLESRDIRDEGRIRCDDSTHELTPNSGSHIPSRISLF